MSDQTDKLINLIKPFGLSEPEAKIYLFLLEEGSQTALTLSRELKMGRTRIYRLLDKLKEKQLILFEVEERGLKFEATHPSKLQHLVVEKKLEAHKLEKILPDVLFQLENNILKEKKKSKVVYYNGVEGLKQVNYNITKADKILRVFEVGHMEEFMPFDFAEKIRQEMVNNQIVTKDLTNKKTLTDFTQVNELIAKYDKFSYISPKKLKIQFETLIYNDVYATYSYQNQEIFCVEIYNQELAAMQKQLFDFIWDQARPLVYTSKFGAAKLVGK